MESSVYTDSGDDSCIEALGSGFELLYVFPKDHMFNTYYVGES